MSVTYITLKSIKYVYKLSINAGVYYVSELIL